MFYFSVVPEVLTCFDPVLKLLLSCTDDVEIGLPIYHEFKDALLQQYCANDAEIAAGKEYNKIQTAMVNLIYGGDQIFMKR